MIGWLQLTNEQRKAVIDEAEQLSGISAKAIEKDWWVTLVLKALFQSTYRDYMVFKGGTSLSKGWNLISRFSEDIDIALDPQAFGMKYIEHPSKNHVEKLKREGCEFTSNALRVELEKQFKKIGVSEGMITVQAAPVPANHPDTDPQTLLVGYPSLYEPSTYIADEVKIEVSVRSLRIPFTAVAIESLLHAINPKSTYAETPFLVDAVEPKKTFLEKIFLLHEEFGKPDKTKIKTERMSRHLYDLFKMMHTEIAANALADDELYDHLIQHREWYSRISWVDYKSLGHTTVSFLPSAEMMDDYQKDYQTMQEQMIYEDAAPFDKVITDLKLLQGKLRLKHEHKTLDEIIDTSRQEIMSDPFFVNKKEGSVCETTVSYHTDPYLPKSPANKTVIYTVRFFYKDSQLIFESIIIAGLPG